MSFETVPLEHFRMRAPRQAVTKAFGAACAGVDADGYLVLHLLGEPPHAFPSLDGRGRLSVPFPFAMVGLVDLALDDQDYSASADDEIDLLVPRHPFDLAADVYSTDRITGLDLHIGGAVGDATLAGLRNCLACAASIGGICDDVVCEVASALHVYLAQRFGGLSIPAPPVRGGLTQRQLRLALDAMTRCLDQELSLGKLAALCGLSATQFSRCFLRSTGLSPHCWLRDRRVTEAKTIMRSSSMPLAEVALHCGFADQSHFTRVFARVEELTPGRWRDLVAPRASQPAVFAARAPAIGGAVAEAQVGCC